MIARNIFRLMAKAFPFLGHFVKEAYYTLNGWRFDDLKNHVTDSAQFGSSTSSMALEHTFKVAQSSGHSPGTRIAFVSCLPPEDTGIATCSFYSWLGASDLVDIFCPVTDLDWFFFLGKSLERASQSGPRLFDVAGFLTLNAVEQYTDIVIATGNSNHHLYIFDLLKKLSSIGTLERVTLYVHDPCLLNLVQRGAKLSSVEYQHVLEDLYGRPVERSKTERHDHHAYIQQGIFGARYFASLGIVKFLVNSTAASIILKRDLEGTNSQVLKVFHPAFLPAGVETLAMEKLNSDKIVIGTFGIPNLGKKTDLIIEAAQHLRKSGQKIHLLIAGFQARTFAERFDHLLQELDHTIFDGPTDIQLVKCMTQCDVAVQLRKENLGESSGIVPQLLMLGKSVIVPRLGAFNEYGDAVCLVDPDLTASDLAAEILSAHQSPKKPTIIRQYVEDRSPTKFRAAFFELVSLDSLDANRIASDPNDSSVSSTPQ